MSNEKKVIESNDNADIAIVGGSLLVIGCNYHTTWQSNKGMRFVLKELKGSKARLETRNTNKNFWTNISDLIFIETGHNKRKAQKLA